jgi:hypothetical protein
LLAASNHQRSSFIRQFQRSCKLQGDLHCFASYIARQVIAIRCQEPVQAPAGATQKPLCAQEPLFGQKVAPSQHVQQKLSLSKTSSKALKASLPTESRRSDLDCLSLYLHLTEERKETTMTLAALLPGPSRHHQDPCYQAAHSGQRTAKDLASGLPGLGGNHQFNNLACGAGQLVAIIDRTGCRRCTEISLQKAEGALTVPIPCHIAFDEQSAARTVKHGELEPRRG